MEKTIKLLSLNVNGKTEKKNGLTYLSWAWAWAEFIKVYPNATYKIMKNESNFATFGNNEQGYMCYTEVDNGEGLTHEMWLPVMDFKNKSILNPTTFDVNKTIMRCLTKNLAMFGLGLYIYAGEDLPEDALPQEEQKKTTKEPIEKEKELHVKGVAKLKELVTTEQEATLLKNYKVKSIEELTLEQLKESVNKIIAVKNEVLKDE